MIKEALRKADAHVVILHETKKGRRTMRRTLGVQEGRNERVSSCGSYWGYNSNMEE